MHMRGKLPIFAYRDTWSMDQTLSPIIAAGIRKFKEAHVQSQYAGCGSNFIADCGFSDMQLSDADHQICIAKWHDVLDDMIFAFDYVHLGDSMNEHWDAYADSLSMDFEAAISGEDNAPRRCHVNCDKTLQAKYEERRLELEARYDRGMAAFAKYFRNLWI